MLYTIDSNGNNVKAFRIIGDKNKCSFLMGSGELITFMVRAFNIPIAEAVETVKHAAVNFSGYITV